MKPNLFFYAACAFSIAACGNEAPSAGSNPAKTSEASAVVTGTEAAGSSASTLPADAPVITVATTGTGVPVTYKDEKGNLTGIDVDVVKAVGEKEGFQVKVIQVAWKDIFTGLEEKKYDIAVAGISWTEERAGKYGMSDSYFFNPTSIMYKTDSTVQPKSLQELENTRIGVLQGSSYEKLAETLKPKQVIPSAKGVDAFKALAQGETDVYLHSNISLRYLQANYPEQNLTIQIVEKPDDISAQRVMALNKENKDLLNKVNSGIAKLKAEGTIDKITEHHLAIARMQKDAKQ